MSTIVIRYSPAHRLWQHNVSNPWLFSSDRTRCPCSPWLMDILDASSRFCWMWAASSYSSLGLGERRPSVLFVVRLSDHSEIWKHCFPYLVLPFAFNLCTMHMLTVLRFKEYCFESEWYRIVDRKISFIIFNEFFQRKVFDLLKFIREYTEPVHTSSVTYGLQ